MRPAVSIGVDTTRNAPEAGAWTCIDGDDVLTLTSGIPPGEEAHVRIAFDRMCAELRKH